MSWIFLSLAGCASFAATGILDKVLISRHIEDSLAYLVAIMLVQQLFSIFVVLWKGCIVEYPWTFLALIVGSLEGLMVISYVMALEVEEVSRVTAQIFVYPLFVFPAAAALFGERLTVASCAGGLLLIASAALASYRPSKGGRIFRSPAFPYLLAFWATATICSLSSKYLLLFMDEWQMVIWTSIGGISIVPFLLIDSCRRCEVRKIFEQGRAVKLAVLLEEMLDFIGRASSIFATNMGSIALVTSIYALQPLMVLFMVASLSRLRPSAMDEEVKGAAMGMKVCAVLLMVPGIYLIS